MSYLDLFLAHKDGTGGLPRGKLVRDSLTACEKIGSSATTIEEARKDPKARKLRV